MMGPVKMYRATSVDFRRLPFLVLIHLNMLKQVPNPLLGLASILASIKQLRIAIYAGLRYQRRWLSVFLFLYNGHFNLVKVS